MRAYEISESFGVDSLALREYDPPVPRDDEVLIRLEAASLNYRDLLITNGHLKLRKPLPLIPLSDGAGQIVETGKQVSRFKVGERVAANFFQSWLEGQITPDKFSSALGGSLNGVLVEFLALNENGVVKIPDHLSYEEGATLPCAAVTAWNALVSQNPIRAGETVLI